MLSNVEKSQLKAIIQQPGWRVIEKLAEEYCDAIRKQPKVKDTEWETVSGSLLDEGKTRGITDFLKEIINQF